MNLSKAYFSSNQRLNHAAINPCFSLMESLSRQDNFDKQYRFMPAEEAVQTLCRIKTSRLPPLNSIPQLFTTERPNVILIILESFSSKLMETLGGVVQMWQSTWISSDVKGYCSLISLPTASAPTVDWQPSSVVIRHNRLTSIYEVSKENATLAFDPRQPEESRIRPAILLRR